MTPIQGRHFAKVLGPNYQDLGLVVRIEAYSRWSEWGINNWDLFYIIPIENHEEGEYKFLVENEETVFSSGQFGYEEMTKYRVLIARWGGEDQYLVRKRKVPTPFGEEWEYAPLGLSWVSIDKLTPEMLRDVAYLVRDVLEEGFGPKGGICRDDELKSWADKKISERHNR